MSGIDEKLEKINKIVGPDAFFNSQEELDVLTMQNQAIIDSVKSSIEEIVFLNNKSIIKYIELGKFS